MGLAGSQIDGSPGRCNHFWRNLHPKAFTSKSIFRITITGLVAGSRASRAVGCRRARGPRQPFCYQIKNWIDGFAGMSLALNQMGQVIDPDNDEACSRLNTCDRENVLVRLLMSKSRYSKQSNHCAIVR